jgi:hypothetical protein
MIDKIPGFQGKRNNNDKQKKRKYPPDQLWFFHIQYAFLPTGFFSYRNRGFPITL